MDPMGTTQNCCTWLPKLLPSYNNMEHLEGRGAEIVGGGLVDLEVSGYGELTQLYLEYPHVQPPIFQPATPPKTNMEPKKVGFEDDFPFQRGDFQVPC